MTKDENPAGIQLEKPMTEARRKAGLRREAQGKSMNRQIIDELIAKAVDAPQTYKKVYAHKDNLTQTRGVTQSGQKVFNVESERQSKTGPGTIKDRTTYNPKTGNITESTVGAPPLDSDKYKKVRGAYPRTKKEYGYDEAAANKAVESFFEKTRSYPKVEGYLRNLDKRRIDEGEDVPVTKREKAVRQADENAAIKRERSMKSFDEQTAEYFVKCHSHVLFAETEDDLKAKKKEAPKAKDHVFGADPKDKRGSEYEMVEKKEPEAYKSEESDLVKAVDSLLEKAVYGVGTRGGKVHAQGTHKDTPEHSKGRSVSLSPERQKEIEERSRKKARTQAQIGGLHGQAEKLKSVDERTSDLSKTLYDIVNRKKFSRIDPDSGWDKIKEQRMDRDAAKLKESIDADEKRLGEGTSGPMKKKSLDDRTIDLVKALTSEREKEIHSAASLVRLAREGMHKEAREIKAKPEDVVRVARTHNNIIAARTQKSICDKWQDSAFVTKGARVMPIGPGGQVQDLSKDEKKKDDEDRSWAKREEKRDNEEPSEKRVRKPEGQSWGDYYKNL